MYVHYQWLCTLWLTLWFLWVNKPYHAASESGWFSWGAEQVIMLGIICHRVGTGWPSGTSHNARRYLSSCGHWLTQRNRSQWNARRCLSSCGRWLTQRNRSQCSALYICHRVDTDWLSFLWRHCHRLDIDSAASDGRHPHLRRLIAYMYRLEMGWPTFLKHENICRALMKAYCTVGLIKKSPARRRPGSVNPRMPAPVYACGPRNRA